ncbi:MAG: IPT/TIG domain-containing protein [Capsulimonas sp.]|uniref:IPT/TIG domain-containing protein n=1 Tax=Capsulimonas sp. TaxID=2494211 RepID=UPI0032668EF6
MTGSGFENDTTASVNGGSPLVTKYVSSTELSASVPREALNGVSQLNVTVYTPPAGGGTSNSLAVGVTVPTLTSITPNRVDPGAVNPVVTFTGVNFDPHAVVTINDKYTVTPTVLSSTKLTAALPASVTGTPGVYFVRVVNPGWSNYSAPVHLTIARATPVISSLSPDRIGAGLSSLSVYVYGTGFIAGSKVTFNGGAAVTPTSIQANRLVVPIPAPILAQKGSYPIRVVNSFADGGASEPKSFVVAPRPVLTTITPTSIKAGSSPVTMTLIGANFEAGSVVTVSDTYTVTPTLISSTKLTAVLPSPVSSKAGSYFVRVVNPGYTNNSAPKSFVVTAN